MKRSQIREHLFLDLDIKIDNKKLSQSSYNKRDSFQFSIVRMLWLSSNMPSKIFYAVLGAVNLSIARTTPEPENFKSPCAKIISRMMKQGGT